MPRDKVCNLGNMERIFLTEGKVIGMGVDYFFSNFFFFFSSSNSRDNPPMSTLGPFFSLQT